MAYKDIALFVFSVAEDEPVLAIVEQLSPQENPHMAAVLVQLEPDPPVSPDGIIIGAIWGDIVEQFSRQFAAEIKALEKRCALMDSDVEVRALSVSSGLAASAAVTQARHTDLSIMLRPRGVQMAEVRSRMFEALLFRSGRPVLLVPPEWKSAAAGRRIVIAWDGKREAVRATADAMPLLREADKVFVVTLDANPSAEGLGPEPGADIAIHLARHGLNLEVRRTQTRNGDEAAALIQTARDVDADLIVMGGFGHSRLGEMVFGGLTRSMLKACPIPLFLSH